MAAKWLGIPAIIIYGGGIPIIGFIVIYKNKNNLDK